MKMLVSKKGQSSAFSSIKVSIIMLRSFAGLVGFNVLCIDRF